MSAKHRTTYEQSFECQTCLENNEPDGTGSHPLKLKHRKAALLHNKKTGHHVVGVVTHHYDYPEKE
jgi:hypothetical protein